MPRFLRAFARHTKDKMGKIPAIIHYLF